MNFLDVIILSIVEGITEFLPISSTGHLVLTSHLLGLQQTEFLKSFEVIIQLGSILAVVILFFNKFFSFKKGIAINQKVWINVIAAFIPTAIIGFALYKVIKGFLLGNELITVAALFIGGIALIVLEKVYISRHSRGGGNPQEIKTDPRIPPKGTSFEEAARKDDGISSIEELSIKQSMGIGLAQSVSIIPGVSRSAASILGGMFLGANRQTAVEFSFLLAIPTMMAATALDLIETNFTFSASEWQLLIIGFIGSFIVALVVVKWFVKYVQSNTFIPFGIYRIIVSIFYFIFILY